MLKMQLQKWIDKTKHLIRQGEWSQYSYKSVQGTPYLMIWGLHALRVY